MQAVGIIAEYNPFHNGHLYHLQRARKISGADVVVALMSGNFTQRGEPTIIDKWQRTNEALHSGVDLVIELPFAVAVQPAHLFAKGALQLLDSLSVRDVVFGAEHPDWPFTDLVQAEANFDSHSFERYNATYATLFNEQLNQQMGIELTEPNDILAFAYYKAVKRLNSPISLHPISRVGSAYHDLVVKTGGTIASASAIRQAVATHDESYLNAVSETTIQDLKSLKRVPNWHDLYPYLRYQLTQAPIGYLRNIYQMAEGLEFRMKEIAETATNFNEFIEGLKTKRYTYSRLIRVCLYTLLQISNHEMEDHVNAPYMRVLGFNGAGRDYLHTIKKGTEIPLVTRLNRELKEEKANLDYRAGKLYEQVTGGRIQDMKRRPLII